MTLQTVRGLADIFTTSLTATAVRLVHLGSYPAAVVVSDAERIRWFRRGPDVPLLLWPHVPSNPERPLRTISPGKARRLVALIMST